ncbi:helix-turn-helix transcriptional regulator [Streptomyces sp. 7-21]|uniref:helix-turn-helix transcriptional regulator n=1 Tax=Streptomyces sp. 7-21 TaxID=2802283 RepID=UPI0027DD531F|nr:helix-turn-helix transcriptional regulator [Streptomyces sp. 7-21]
MRDIGETAIDELDAVAVRVYQLRVAHPTDLVSQLAARAGLSPEEVSHAEKRLSGLGLLQPSPGGGWVAVSPEAAAESLLAPLEQEILQRRIAMAATRERLHALSGDYLEARSLRSARTSIEIIEDLGNIRAVIDDLARTCTTSVDVLAPGRPTEEGVRAAAPLDMEVLARGVRLRMVYQYSARGHRFVVQHVERIVAKGAQVRCASALASRMLIYDESCALLPLDPGDASKGAALVRDPSVLGFLCLLFSHYWDTAEDFLFAERPEPGAPPRGMERDVLLLLAAGKTNEAIAEQLGVSRRSVSRLVGRLMDRLGASNRFQAGAKAAHLGWLA